MSSTKEQIIMIADAAPPQGPNDTIPAIKTNNDKADEEFRVYNQETTPQRVVDHYRDMRLHHTVAFYKHMEQKYDFSNGAFRKLMTMEEAFEELEEYVDASDPDMDLPNKLHLLQTAEGIRRAGHPGTHVAVGCFD
jgi:inositol oxygenase